MGNKINGAALRRLREERGMTEGEVARKAGISIITYLKIEDSEAYNTYNTLSPVPARLAVALCRDSYRGDDGLWHGFEWNEFEDNIRELIIEEEQK